MNLRNAWVILLAAAIATSAQAGSRQAVPHSGGGGPRMGSSAPHGMGSATGGARGHVPPHGTANGTAHYGYGHGGYYWGGYPGWGWGWGSGWYGGWGWGWGWPYYGYYGYPGYDYPPYDPSYYYGSGEAPPPHGPATVETAVSPSKAEVLLDGEPVGFAGDYSGRWDKLTLSPGQHTITFQKSGYRTLVVTLDAHPGATYVLRDALAEGTGQDARTVQDAGTAGPPAPLAAQPPAHAPEQSPSQHSGPIGRLRVHAEPPDTAVYLDGEYLGLGAELARIHGALAVGTGSHRLEAVRPGYVSVTRTIDVGETDLAAVEVILERQP